MDHRKLVVTQANALASAIQDMTLLEKRLILLYMAVIRRSDVNLPFVRMYMADLRRIYDIKSNALSAAVDEATNKLMMRFAAFPRGQGSFSKYSWVNEVHYTSGHDSENGQAYLDMQLHAQVSAFLLELTGQFNSIPFEVLRRIQSMYALRLCELLYHESHGGKIRRLSFELDRLKDILACNTRTYSNFADFRKRVLEPAEKENKEVGFLAFSYVPLKRGRRVTGIEFAVTVSENKGKIDDLVTPDPEHVEDLLARITLENTMRESGFKESPRRFVDELGVDLVSFILKECRNDERREKGGKNEIRSFGGYLHHKLKQALEDPAPWRQRIGKMDAAEEGFRVVAKRVNGQEAAKLADLLVQNLAAERMAFAMSRWAELSEEEQEVMMKRMCTEFDPRTLKLLEDANWEGAPYRTAIKRMFEVDNLEYPEDLQGINEFVKGREWFTDLDDKDRNRILSMALEAV
jgi:plasmid replication initiation protein